MEPTSAQRALSIFALVTDGQGVEGGIARYNAALLAALAASPTIERVDVLARRIESAASVDAKIDYAPPSRSKSSLALASVKRACFGRSYDIVFCGHLNMLPIAWLLARRWRAKLWVQMHGIECWQPPAAHLRAFAERADLITCVSRYTRTRVLEWCDIAAERVRVLPNTLSDQFQAAQTRAPRPSSNRSGTGGTLRALTVGRLSACERYKGHDVMIEAVALLRGQGTPIDYLIAGDGDDRPRLEQLAQQLGVEKCVRFLGRVSEAELPKLYDAADVFVMPSTGEGFGIVFLEALQRGCAVIGTDADGSVDPLRDGHDGYLVRPNDPPALADTLRSLAHADAPRRATANVFSRQSFDAHVGRLLSLIA